MKTVVIVGGGFAGITSAKKQVKDFKVVLISKSDVFVYKPMLPEVAASKADVDKAAKKLPL